MRIFTLGIQPMTRTAYILFLIFIFFTKYKAKPFKISSQYKIINMYNNKDGGNVWKESQHPVAINGQMGDFISQLYFLQRHKTGQQRDNSPRTLHSLSIAQLCSNVLHPTIGLQPRFTASALGSVKV